MDGRNGFMLLFLSHLLGNYFTYSTFDVSDLVPIKCRIAGVALLERKDSNKKFNYTMAEDACEALGMQLASRANVVKAWSYSYETCSYGWVTERFAVISRIQHNINCGRNKTGVLTWTKPLSEPFNAYCFNASDIRINSCKPELMVTTVAITEGVQTTTPPSTAAGSTSPPPALLTSAATPVETTVSSVLPTTSWPIVVTTMMTTIMTTPKPTPKRTAPPSTTPGETTLPTTEEPPNPPENHTAQKNGKIVFGGLPTALLILALMFFLAAVALAVCYVRKYKTNLIFRKIKEEKENVEAKVFRETGEYASRGEDKLTNGKEETPQQGGAGTGRSLEAEV